MTPVRAAVISGMLAAIGSVTDLAGNVAIIAAGAAGVGYLTTMAYRLLIRPVVHIVSDAADSYDRLQGLPDTLVGLEVRIQAVEARSEENHEMVAAITRELGIEHRWIPPHTPEIPPLA